MKRLAERKKVTESSIIEEGGNRRLLDALRRTLRVGSEATYSIRADAFREEDLAMLDARERV